MSALRITRAIEVSIIVPGQKRVRHRLHADKGCHFTQSHIQHLLQQEAKNIDEHLPDYDFKLVELSASQFNFVGTYNPYRTHRQCCITDEMSAASSRSDSQQKSGGTIQVPIDSPARSAFPTDETSAPSFITEAMEYVRDLGASLFGAQL